MAVKLQHQDSALTSCCAGASVADYQQYMPLSKLSYVSAKTSTCTVHWANMYRYADD